MKFKHQLFWAIALSFSTLACKPSAELTQQANQAKQDLQQCQEESERAQARISDLRAQLNDRNAKLQESMSENNRLSAQLANTQAALESTTREMQASSDKYGIWFRVQIGAFQDPKIDQTLQTNEEGMGLENSGDLQKIVLGRFRSYEPAKQLQAQIQSLGVKDAWIASYKDGVRIPIEEAMKNQ